MVFYFTATGNSLYVAKNADARYRKENITLQEIIDSNN